MEQREVKDEAGITWTCIQAYAGMNSDTAEKAANLTEKEDPLVTVVCTPDGGAQTVRLRLPSNWIEQISDEELLRKISSSSDGTS